MISKSRRQILPPVEIAEELLQGFRVKPIWHGYVADVFYCEHPNGGENYYLKRHKVKSSHDSVKEFDVINWLQGRLAVPTVKRFVQAGQYYYLLLTALPGTPAHKLIQQLRPYAMIEILVKAMRHMHSIPIENCPLDETIAAKLKRIRYNLDHGFLRKDIYKKQAERSAEQDLQYLIENPPAAEDLVFTHGDFCLPNFLVTDCVVTGFVDLGEAGVCDRYMDICTLAITMCYNYKCFDRFFEFARLIFAEYGIQTPDWTKLHYYHLVNEML